MTYTRNLACVLAVAAAFWLGAGQAAAQTCPADCPNNGCVTGWWPSTVQTAHELRCALCNDNCDSIAIQTGAVLEGSFTITRSVELVGDTRPVNMPELRLGPFDTGSVLHITPGGHHVVLEGLRIADGAAGSPGGGGLFNEEGRVEIRSCVFENNRVTGLLATDVGGAILNRLGTMQISDSTFSNNGSPFGGGAIASIGRLAGFEDMDPPPEDRLGNLVDAFHAVVSSAPEFEPWAWISNPSVPGWARPAPRSSCVVGIATSRTSATAAPTSPGAAHSTS